MTNERPFGSINIGAEMAVTMGEDPRPYMTDEEIRVQVSKTGMTLDQWNRAMDDKIKKRAQFGVIK